jgi:hypothetical protein
MMKLNSLSFCYDFSLSFGRIYSSGSGNVPFAVKEIQEVSSSAEPEKKKPAAAKEPKPKAGKAAAKAADSIISQVRQAPLADSEVQALIDILLLKQVPVL